MKAQAGLEYVIIIGFIIAVTIPIAYYALDQSSQNVRINEINDAVHSLGQKADSLATIGPGSRDYIWITIPTGIATTSIENKTILASSQFFGDITSITKTEVSGTLPKEPGLYKMRIEVLENKVIIGPVNDTFGPNVIDTTPKNTIGITNPIITATTNEPASCKYDSIDKNYASMFYSFAGTGISHTKQLSGLLQGPNTLYVRCMDSMGNAMQNSALINFTVISDSVAPMINNTNSSLRKLKAGENTCISANITDTTTIADVWAKINFPVSPPLQTTFNYTLYDNGLNCDIRAGDKTYSNYVAMQIAGINILATVYANDSAGNIGYQNPFPNIQINVSSNVSIGPGQGLTYVVPDLGKYYKTPSDIGYTAKDSQMSTLTSLLADLTDEDKNTPSSSYKFYYTPVNTVYEGYIFGLNNPKTNYEYLSLRLKVKDAEVIPYALRIYAYDSDSDSIITANSTQFNVTNVIVSGSNRGYNEFMITDAVMAGKSANVKVRVVAESLMDKKTMHITEADFGVA